MIIQTKDIVEINKQWIFKSSTKVEWSHEMKSEMMMKMKQFMW